MTCDLSTIEHLLAFIIGELLFVSFVCGAVLYKIKGK